MMALRTPTRSAGLLRPAPSPARGEVKAERVVQGAEVAR
jgi:hypothetical protein